MLFRRQNKIRVELEDMESKEFRKNNPELNNCNILTILRERVKIKINSRINVLY